jgi:hypothetical protein
VVANGCLGVGQMLGDNVYASAARVSPSPADAFEQINPPVNELLLLDTKSWHLGGKARG